MIKTVGFLWNRILYFQNSEDYYQSVYHISIGLTVVSRSHGFNFLTMVYSEKIAANGYPEETSCSEYLASSNDPDTAKMQLRVVYGQSTMTKKNLSPL